MRFLPAFIIASLLLTSSAEAQLFRRLVNPQQQQLQFLRQQQLRRQFEARRLAAERAAEKAQAEARKKAKATKKKTRENSVADASRRKSAVKKEQKNVKAKKAVTEPREPIEATIADVPEEMLGPKTLKHQGFGITLKLIRGKVVVAAMSKSGMANQAGVMKGDVVSSVGSMPIQMPQDITGFDKVLSPGDMLDFELVRKGKKKKIVVPYKKKPIEEGTVLEDAVAGNDKYKVTGNATKEELEPIASTTPLPEAIADGEPTPAIRMESRANARPNASVAGKPLDLDSLLDGPSNKDVSPPKPPVNDGLFELPETGNKVPDANKLIDNEIRELRSLIEEHKLLIRSAQRRLDDLKKSVKSNK